VQSDEAVFETVDLTREVGWRERYANSFFASEVTEVLMSLGL